MVNHQQVIIQALALLLNEFGDPIPVGKEIYFSDVVISGLSPHGQIQVDRHPEKPGFIVRYLANQTIDGEFKIIEPMESLSPPELPQ